MFLNTRGQLVECENEVDRLKEEVEHWKELARRHEKSADGYAADNYMLHKLIDRAIELGKNGAAYLEGYLNESHTTEPV